MKLESIGYNHIHNENFVFDRRLCGAKTWLFLLVKTPAIFMQEDGNEVVIRKNSFVIYKANTPHFYRAYNEKYIKGGCLITEKDSYTRPVTGIRNGAVIGYKYFDFGQDCSSSTMEFSVNVLGAGCSAIIRILIDNDQSG